MFAIMSGPLGAGKTLAAVGLISEYLGEGRKVATNIDLAFDQFKNHKLLCNAMSVGDKPTREALTAIGRGHDEDKPNEERNGLLILDEAAMWLNSRAWNETGRKEIVQWFVHARKRRWDVVLIAQHEEVIDRSVRNMFGEHSIKVSNLSKIKIPVVGWIGRFVGGKPWTFPKIHQATWIVNAAAGGLHLKTDRYSGKDLYHMFDTEQGFSADDETGPYCYLSPWHLKGRYEKARRAIQWKKGMVLMGKAALYGYARLWQSLGLLQREGRQFRPVSSRRRVSVPSGA